jgi:hypothetical protein
MHILLIAAAGADSCGASTTGHCSINSPTSDVFAIVIVALIVGLILFEVLWKVTSGTSGPLSRIMIAVAIRLSRLGNRSRGRTRR